MDIKNTIQDPVINLNTSKLQEEQDTAMFVSANGKYKFKKTIPSNTEILNKDIETINDDTELVSSNGKYKFKKPINFDEEDTRTKEEKIEDLIVPVKQEPIIDPKKRKEELSHRMRDINNEIQSLNKKEKKLLSGITSSGTTSYVGGLGPSGTMESTDIDPRVQEKLNEIRAKKAELVVEHKSVQRLANPITPEKLKEMQEGTFSDIKEVNGEWIVNKLPDFNSLLKKYTIPEINDAQNVLESDAIERRERDDVASNEQLKIPQASFRFAAFKYGTVPRVNQDELNELEKEWRKVLKSGAWDGHGKLMPINRNDRIKISLDHLKNYVDTKFKDSEPEVRKNKLYEYSKVFGGLMNVNSDGSPSIEGLQSAALDRQSLIEDKLNKMSVLHRKLKQLKRQGRLNGQDAYLEWIGEEEKKLKTAKEFNEGILKLPVKKSGGKDIIGMFTDNGAVHGKLDEIATLGIKSAMDMMTTLGTAKKVEKGEQLSWGEQTILETYAQLNEAENLGTTGIWYQTAGAIADMIPYFATYGVTQKLIYTPVQKVVERAMLKAIPESLVKAGTFAIKNERFARTVAMKEVNVPKLAVKWGSRSIGVLAQTAANPHSTMKYSAEREMPEMSVSIPDNIRDLITILDKNTGEKHWEALFKGFFMNVGDIGFEHSGDYVGKLAKTPGRFFKSYILNKEIPETYFLKQSAKLFGYKAWNEKVKGFVENTMGWHGPIKEYGEELATQIFQNAVTGDEYGTLPDFLKQQLVTALAVIIPGLPINLGKAGMKYRRFGDIGDDVAYIKTDKEGKKSNIVIPKIVHDDLMEAFNQDLPSFATSVTNLIDKYVNTKDESVKLNEEQTKFIVALAMQESQNKYQKQLLIDHLQSKGYKIEDYENEVGTESEEPLTEEELKADRKTLTGKQLDKILLKNRKKFQKKYPLLYQEGLLPRDNTGQYRDPDGAYLMSLLSELDSRETDLSEIDQSTGQYRVNDETYIKQLNEKISALKEEEQTPDITNQILTLENAIEEARYKPSPELKTVIDQKNIVQSELDELSDRVSIPFNYLLPSEKHERILSRLNDGEKIKGKGILNEGTMRSMLVKLDNGDQVKVYLNKDKESVIAAQTASRKQLELTFEYEAKQDWNPDDKHVEIVINKNTGKLERVPYGDRIKVLSEGKVIGAVEIHDYNEEGARAAKYRKALELALNKESEAVNNLIITPDGFKLNKKEEKKLKKMIDDLVSDLGRMLDLPLEESITWLQNQISNNTRLNDLQKKVLNFWINEHKAEIERSVASQKFVNAGLAKKIVKLNTNSWHFESTDAVALSSAQKLKDNLITFFKLWQQIGEKTGHSREQIELAFHEIAMLPSLSSVKDETTYKEWLVNSRNTGSANEALIRELIETRENGELVIPFTKMVSALNFYSNLRLIKQVASILEASKTKSGISAFSLQDLNPSETYQEFLDKFTDRFKSLSNDELRRIFASYKAENTSRFNFASTMTPNELYAVRIKQHEADLKLLYDLTGIDWSSYFTSQTNETEQLATEEHNISKTDFGTYDNLMRSQAFRWSPAMGRFAIWEQSNLVLNLKLVAREYDDNVFRQNLINFFIKGNNNVFSNIYKLTTAQGKIGLNGQDVKGDTFSSFQQYSDFLKTADDIMTSNVDNYLVDYFKSLNKPIEIIIINGIHNRAEKKNRFKKGVPSTNMSMEDIWFTLMSNFGVGKETYLQNIGQFADKPYLYQTYVPKVFMPSADQIKDADNLLNVGFNRTVDSIVKNIANRSQSYFSDLAKNYPSTVSESENYIINMNERIRNFVSAFVFNYTMNQNDLNEIFFGAQESYKDINDLYKRAGSTNSPGYRLNTNIIGGVGKTFNFAVINDKKIYDKDGNILTLVGMDGYVFFDGNLSGNIQTSMGDIYSKKDLYPTLTTMKALISGKNKDSNRRLLVKGNWYNVHSIADNTNSETVAAIRDFMRKNNIHVLGIGTSTEGTKVKTSSVKMLDEGQEIKFFNDDGTFNENAEIIHKNDINDFDINKIGNIRKISTTPDGHSSIYEATAETWKYFAQSNEKEQTWKDNSSRVGSVRDKIINNGWLPDTDNDHIYGQLYSDNGINIFDGHHRLIALGQVDPKKIVQISLININHEPNFYWKPRKANIDIGSNKAVFHIIEKSWDDVYVQQDLRHSSEPKSAKQPSQNFTTMLSLDVGQEIALLTAKIQKLGIDNLIREFNSKESDESKREWALNNVSEYSQKELFDLLNLGLTVDDPVYRKMIRKIMASAVKRQALELPINRNVAIEIADLDNQMEELRKVTVEGVERVLLPDAAANITGARAHNYKYLGRSDEAIKYVEEHWALYPDLFDENHKIMDWEIKGRDGVIPGELVFLTRVPNSGFSTFDVARLKTNMGTGNFAMINRKGQVASSSDFDGDMRYVQTAFKIDDIPLGMDYDNTQEGIANKIMRLVAKDYTNPKFFDRINYMIDTNAYDDIIEDIPTESYSWTDPLAYQSARLNNKVGLDMKGGMTNLLTVYSLLSRYKIPLRRGTSIAKDEYGAIRAHMENFLTMFFDNQKDPKVEKMGFNEITGNMFILMLIGKEQNGSNHYPKGFEEHYSAIHDSIKEQVKYFTSPLMRDFIEEMRRENGGLRTKDQNVVFKQLMINAGTTYTEEDVRSLRTFYSMAKELSDIKALHTLTQEVPDTQTDLIIAKRLVAKAKANSSGEGGFKLLDIRNMLETTMDENNKMTTRFVSELSAIDDVIDIAENFIFDDVVESTPVGKQVFSYVLTKLIEKHENKPTETGEYKQTKKELTKDEMDGISSAINNVFNIRAIGLKIPFKYIAEALNKQIPLLKKNFPGNAFLAKITITDGVISIDKEFTKTKIHDAQLEIIKADFDKLPDDVKDLFATYQIEKYGSSQVTSNGGFYKLFGNNYKVELSKRARAEINDWYFGDISPMERLAIADWVIRANKSFDIRQLQEFNTTEDRLVNYYTDPSFATPLHRDTMESIESVEDINEFNRINGSKGLNVINEDLFNWVSSITGITGDELKTFASVKKTRGVISGHLSKRRAIAEKFFPQVEQLSDEEIQDMYSDSPHMQMMLSFDDNLNEFIYNHLHEQFPGIQMFTDREAFYNYIRQNTNRMIDVNLEAVGHSFRSAIFIDPSEPVQEAMFHEHTHIYWNNLPVDHPVKVKLRSLYSEIYDSRVYTPQEIDEFIVTDIGRAGTDMAEKYIDDSILDRFIEYMKDFWNSVKIYFGKYSKTDLVNNMARAVWTNRANIKPNSKSSDAHINNLILTDLQSHDVLFNEKKYTCSAFGKPMPGITSIIDFFKYDKFDADATMDQKIKEFERYWRETRHKEPTEEDIYEFSLFLEQKWKDQTRFGNVIHKLSEEVFGNKTIDYSKINNEFANADILGNLRASLIGLKENIIDEYETKYNNEILSGKRKGNLRKISFRTEVPLVSVKDNVFGFADLIVDLGENHTLIFDLKTTEREFLNSDKSTSDYYKKEFSFMMAPMTKIKQSKEVVHKLQLLLEAKILEDQVSDINPDEKNIIDGLFIVPIITQTANGKISEAHISNTVTIPGLETESGGTVSDPIDNIISVNYVRDIADEMIEAFNKNSVGFDDEYDAFKDKLDKANIPLPTKELYLKAFAYLRYHSNQKLNEIDHDGLESIFGNHYRGLVNKLLMLNYTIQDIKTLPLEVLINVADANITRVEWEKDHEVLYNTVEVGYHSVKESNPKYVSQGTTYYHVNMKDMDSYFHDAGVKSLSENDRIIWISDINYQGKVIRDRDFYTVVKVSKKGRFVDIQHDKSKAITRINKVGDYEGIHKLNTQEEGISKGMTEYNYIPKYIDVRQAKTEMHWLKNNKTASFFGTGLEAEKAFARYKESEKAIWAFYRKYKTSDDAKILKGLKDELKKEFNALYAVAHDKNNLSQSLMNYLKDGAVNHVMAEQIRNENKNGPSAFMPMTLNIYNIITKGSNSFKNLSGLNKIAYWFHPTRKIFAENTGMNWILLELDHKLLKVHNSQFNLRKDISPFYNTLRHKNLIMEVDKKEHWRLPSDESVSKREKEFLDILYDNYYKYVPEYAEELRKHIASGLTIELNGYPKSIPVTRMHATKEEMIHRFGRKWGGIMHDIMADTTYDHMKFNIGGKIVTLEEIKTQFALHNGSDKEMKEWLGPRMQFSIRIPLININLVKFSNIPFIRNLFRVSKSKLYYYFIEARKNYEEGNILNLPASKKGYKISPISDQKIIYKTNYIMESETKVMESNIWAYHMQDLIAPLDYVLNEMEGGGNAFKYLKDFTDLIMFHKSNKLGTEVAQFMGMLQELTSLRFIAFSPRTQLFNITVGQTQNLIREPMALLNGVYRLGFQNALNIKKGSNIGSIIKAINILRSNGLGNLVDDARFDTLAKRAGIKLKWGDKSINFSVDSFKTAGFMPMEFVERLNQIPIFVGLMTQEEWNSYDINGKLKPGFTGMDETRANQIAERVKDVQGDYTPQNAAPAWNKVLGGPAMQFFKWAPTSIDAVFMPYHLDRHYMVRSGILPTIHLIGKVVKQMVGSKASEKIKMEYMRKALLRWPEVSKVESYNKWVDKTFESEKERKERRIDLKNLDESVREKQLWYLKSTHDYMQMLIVGSRNGTIHVKQLSSQDGRNLWSGILKLSIFLISRAALMSGDDETKEEQVFEDQWSRNMTRFIMRYQSDIFLFAGETPTATGPQWGGAFLQRLQNPFPALDIAVKLVQFNVDFWPTVGAMMKQRKINAVGDPEDYIREWWRPPVGYYKNTTNTHLQGEYKMYYDFFKLLPGASALSFLNTKVRMEHILSKPFLQSLRDKGFSEDIVNAYKQSVSENITVEQANTIYKMDGSFRDMLKYAALYRAIQNEPIAYRDIINGEKVVKKAESQAQAIASMTIYMQDFIIDPERFESIARDAYLYLELLKTTANISDKEKIKLYKQRIEEIKSGELRFNQKVDKSLLDLRKKDPNPQDSTSVYDKLKIRHEFLPFLNK